MSELTNKQRYAAQKEQLKSLREVMKQTAKAYFQDEAQTIFEKFPLLECFSWRQYTPYFNDGDECRFGVYYDEPEINGEEVCEQTYDYKTRKYVKTDCPQWKIDAQEAAVEFLSGFAKEDFKDMFGDHVKVTAYKDKVETADYHHD